MILEPCQSRLNSRRNGSTMRALAAILLALTVLAVPPAGAQADSSTAAEPIQLLTDAVADVALTPAGLAAPAGAMVRYDLLGLIMSDDEQSVTFTVATAGFGDDTDGAGSFLVHFRHGEAQYRILLDQQSMVGVHYWATLQRWSDASQMYIWVAGMQPLEDEAASQITASFSKAKMTDEKGAAPFQGRVLDDVWVAATHQPLGGTLLEQTVDVMPDDGQGLPYPVRGGLPQSGLALWSPQPFRASNGEATTYVFTVNLENTGVAGTFLLVAEGLPAGWDVQFPQPTVELGAGTALEVPVLATVPFAHDHGSEPSFLVRAVSETDAAIHGQVRLGVLYMDPPMPAGHHRDLFFHSGLYGSADTPVYQALDMTGRAWVWMNTAEKDEADALADATPAFVYQPPGSTTAQFSWYPYVTQMSIGFDFDLTQPVSVKVPISSMALLPQARLQATLYAGWRTGDGGWESIRVVSLASDAADLGAGERRLYELSGLPAPDADRIEARKDMYLQWTLLLTAERPAAQAGQGGVATPVLNPGGSSHLPLLEYHDPVDEVFAALDGVRLQAEGPSEREVNPGETVLFNLALQNDAQEGSFRLGLRGEHATWARVLGGDRIDMQAGGRERVTVAVTAPADAGDGQSLDLLVEAHGPDGATALLRLAGQVVTGTDLPDESHLVPGLDEQRDSPAPPAAWLALAVLAIAVGLRRRSRLG